MAIAKFKVTVAMTVKYELGLEIMASSPEEAQEKADSIAQGNCDLGEMVYTSDREFTISKCE